MVWPEDGAPIDAGRPSGLAWRLAAWSVVTVLIDCGLFIGIERTRWYGLTVVMFVAGWIIAWPFGLHRWRLNLPNGRGYFALLGSVLAAFAGLLLAAVLSPLWRV